MSLKNNIEITDKLSKTNSVILKQVLRNKMDKLGFDVNPPVTLSFDNGNLRFTITPTGDSFEYWIQGQKFIKYAAETVDINDTEGLWYIYYILDTLTASQTPWNNAGSDKAFISLVYWDAVNNIELYLGYECHNTYMSPATHGVMHETMGTRYHEGLSISLGAGGDIGKIGYTAGSVHDENIDINITDGAGGSLFEQVLTLPAQIPVFYRSGSAAWRKYNAGDYPFYDNSGGDNIHYNLDTAGSWSSQEASGANKYIAMWIYATNEQNEPIIAIMGQNESNTIAGARNDNVLDTLSFGTLPFAEMKILHRLILRTDGGTIESLDLRATSNLPGGTFVPTSHGSLSGLGNDDHTIYILADGTRAISGPITTDTINIATTKMLTFVDGGSVNIIKDEDDMASDDENALVTQQSIKAYVTSGGGLNHNNLQNINAGDAYEHITQTQKNFLHNVLTNLTQLTTRNHNDLQNINAGDVNHLTDVQVAALHAVVVAGDLNHNDLANLNAGDVYEHLSAAQITALHNVLTNLNELATRNHSDLQNKNNEVDIKHLTDAQVAALHNKQHALDEAEFHTSSDIITFNSSIAKHGFLRKLSNIATEYMGGTGLWSVPAGTGDDDAIHDNIAGEIDAIVVKANPTFSDLLIIEDIANGDNKKKIQIGTIPTGGDCSGPLSNIAVANDSHDHTEAHISDLDKYTQAQVDALITPHVDPDAIHDNVAGEIGAIATAQPSTVDKFIFEDTNDGNNKKQNTLGQIDILGHVTGTLGATVVGNDSHTHETQHYTEAEIDALLGIGIANKRWKNLSFSGTQTFDNIYVGGEWRNTGANDVSLVYDLTLPFIIGGTHNLIITRCKVGISDADVDNYLNRFRCFGWSDYETLAGAFIDDGNNKTTAQEVIYDINPDITVGGVYERIFAFIDLFCTNAAQIDISYIKIEYYYT